MIFKLFDNNRETFSLIILDHSALTIIASIFRRINLRALCTFNRDRTSLGCILADKSCRLVDVGCRQDAPLNREIRAHSRNMNLLNIRRHAPSPRNLFFPPFPPSPSTDVLFGSRRKFYSTFYQPRSTVNERLLPPVKDARRRDGKITVRISRRRPGRCGTREKKKGGDPVKTRLTRSSSSYCDEGLHLLTRTTAPLLITQSSGRRLRSAERPAPTPSPPTSTATPTPISPSWSRGSYDMSMLSTYNDTDLHLL